MRPTNIFLVRHGQSMSNINPNIRKIVPDWKIELSMLGYQQALATGNDLVTEIKYNNPADLKTAVYLSPYRRTRQTWCAIRQRFCYHQVSYLYEREDPRLREQEIGNASIARDDLTESERIAYGTFYYRFRDGENGADVYDRMSGFLESLYRDFDKSDFPDNCLIVGHGYALRVLVMRWLHFSVEEFHNMRNLHNAEIYHLVKDANQKYNILSPQNIYRGYDNTNYI